MTTSPWLVLRSRQEQVSFRCDRRVVPILGLGVAFTLLLLVLSVSIGEYRLGMIDVVRAIAAGSDAQGDQTFVIWELRLPRVLVALLVGWALGIAGAIMQGLVRNPLASPDVVGVSAGAGLVAVTLLVVFPTVSLWILPFAAWAGASLAAFLVYILAWSRNDSSFRLILVGIGLQAVATAMTSLILTFGDLYNVQRALVWLTGSVYGRSWPDIWALLPWVSGGGIVALFQARHLDTLHLSEDVALGLGSRVTLRRGLLILIAVALAGASVAVAGTIAFVGLVAPHIARRLVGSGHTGLVPVAAIIGGVIVMTADLVGRTIAPPVQLPCGLVTAAIGAPWLLTLLVRAGRRS